MMAYCNLQSMARAKGGKTDEKSASNPGSVTHCQLNVRSHFIHDSEKFTAIDTVTVKAVRNANELKRWKEKVRLQLDCYCDEIAAGM
jgi:hypothetical protein